MYSPNLATNNYRLLEDPLSARYFALIKLFTDPQFFQDLAPNKRLLLSSHKNILLGKQNYLSKKKFKLFLARNWLIADPPYFPDLSISNYWLLADPPYSPLMSPTSKC